jgi:hypothetical protein
MDELLALRREVGHGFNLALSLQKAASLALERAAAYLAEAQAWVRGTGSRLLSLGWCSMNGALAAARGRWAAAVQLQAFVIRTRADDGVRPDAQGLACERAELDRARAALGAEAYAAAWAAGQALGAAQAFELAAAELEGTAVSAPAG